MSVMSAAEAGANPELTPRGPRMTSSVSDPDDTGAGSGSPGGCPAQPRPQPGSAAGHDPRLRLVTTEVHVTRVRVARQFRSAATRSGTPGVGAQGAAAPGMSALRAGGPGRSAPGIGARRAGVRDAAGPGASAYRVGMQRVSAERLVAPGVSAHRVRVQRASAGRAGARAAAVAPGGVRLTWRGRRVLTGFVMLAAIVTAMLIWTSVAGGAQVPGPGSPARSPYQGMTQIVVRPGQTLWSVAAAAAGPSADPWAVIQQISDVNALNGAQIQAGQLLWVPRG
jgi:hypothetical protein